MQFTLFNSDTCGVASNCSYPHRITVTDNESLKAAVCKDYVASELMNSYRNKDNFISADCLMMDCDNDHSENPEEWVTPEDVRNNFPGVEFAVHYSRSHMKEKNGKPARPKFHILFPINPTTDAETYVEMKQYVQSAFPFFDSQALDASRFFFGTAEPEVEIIEGTMNLTEFLQSYSDEEDFTKGTGGKKEIIREGSRNSTLYRFATVVLKKYGECDEARNAFIEKAKCCEPPLPRDELASIWASAKNFYKRISAEADYIPPEKYNDRQSYIPDDFSDVGQAQILAHFFGDELRYSPATHFLRYSEGYWQESEPGAQAVVHELTRRQLEEANRLYLAAKKLKEALTKDSSDEEIEKAADLESLAASYRKFVVQRRDSKYISSTLKESRPLVEIKPSELDANEFLLNTPSRTYDLRKGLDGEQEQDPDDFITKSTTVNPSKKGVKLWMDFLNTIFCGDRELIKYVQQICGLAAIGKVYVEAMIIAYGSGRNGKSTLWNTIAKVLGNYSGHISADALTVNCKRNIKPEMAETRGKRLLIAAELPEGTRLNDSIVKQLCSTDDIFAEKKYKDPFAFTPCHTLVLYTNHLPKVGTLDDGTWRRLIVIPFNAKIEGKADIKNYSDYLYNNAGEAVLSWIIEGAKKAIKNGFKIQAPKCVEAAVKEYKEQNNWLKHFLDERCETGSGKEFRVGAAELYTAYRKYCDDTNEYTRGNVDFCNALENAGFEKISPKNRRFYVGLRLKEDAEKFADFLS